MTFLHKPSSTTFTGMPAGVYVILDACVSVCRLEPWLSAAVRNFVEAFVPSYLRVPATDEERVFWLSFYNLESCIR